MTRKSIAKWFPALRATPKPKCILRFHDNALIFLHSAVTDTAETSSADVSELTLKSRVIWFQRPHLSFFLRCPAGVLSGSPCCLKFFVVLFIPPGKYRDVVRNWATVLNMLHIFALKEYLNLRNKTNTCTSCVRVHLLVLLHKFKYWPQLFLFTSFPIPYSFAVTLQDFQTPRLFYNRCSSRT